MRQKIGRVCMVLGALLILAAAALPVIWLYNGRPGVNRRWRWAFYAFYPAHLLVLEGIQALT